MNYENVKIERQAILAKVDKLSTSEQSYDFGFGSILSTLYEIADYYHDELKKSGHHDIHSFNNASHSTSDVKAYFNHIDEHMIDSAALKHMHEEYRLLGHIDVMLHMLENSEHRIEDRTGGRVIVTERLNMTTTRI